MLPYVKYQLLKYFGILALTWTKYLFFTCLKGCIDTFAKACNGAGGNHILKVTEDTNSEDWKGLNYKSHPNRFLERAVYGSTVNKATAAAVISHLRISKNGELKKI